MNTYIVGSNNGLGKYLNEKITSVGINRSNFHLIKPNPDNIFIVCAKHSKKYPSSVEIDAFYEDNIKLVENLCEIQHKQIIFMSTVEVYSQNHSDENTEITSEGLNPYAISKLIAENIIANKAEDYVILRLGALLGPYSNNLVCRVLNDISSQTTLDKDSTFNYVLYEDVLKFLRIIIDGEYHGIFNLVSNNNVKLKDALRLIDKKVKYGSYTYKTIKVVNEKVNNITRIFNKKSEQSLQTFMIDLK